MTVARLPAFAMADTRLDAAAKASGRARYAADIAIPGLAHVGVARSTMPHARIVSIDTSAAAASDGVIGVFTAANVNPRTYGRSLCDVPILAQDKVRFVGERVAAVVAHTRQQAEDAAVLVDIEYEPLPAMTTVAETLAAGATPIHDAPWAYDGSVTTQGAHPNVIYHEVRGSFDEVDKALSRAAYLVDHTYRTHGTHQGYLEPQACVADYRSPDLIKLWVTNKTPFQLRDVLGRCFGMPSSTFEIEPIMLGGDFGGKGSPQDAPLCIELSRLTRRPVKSTLSYSEDLTAAAPRHPAEMRVRLGCDQDGRLVAASIRAFLDAGAYGGFTPFGRGPRGATELGSYRFPVHATEVTRCYTNTVPRGNVRAPGGPQGTFALESAMTELALEAGLDPVEFRRRNLLTTGETDAERRTWLEHRSTQVIDAALAAERRIDVPPGWLHGRGIALYSRHTSTQVKATMRIHQSDDGCVRVETGIVETGTGSHTVLGQLLAGQLGLRPDQVDVAAAKTSDLPPDGGVGGSRVTVAMAAAAEVAAKAWRNRLDDKPILIEVDEPIDPHVGSYVMQIAQVAVDPETGELRVLEILTAIDVAEIIHPAAHQMQIDGGVAMGFGFCCLEDLGEAEGQVWAANLSEYKLPSARDVPRYRTIKVPGGVGVGAANIKNIGELTTPPVAPAIANAVFDATGRRLRDLPLTAERIYAAMKEPL